MRKVYLSAVVLLVMVVASSQLMGQKTPLVADHLNNSHKTNSVPTASDGTALPEWNFVLTHNAEFSAEEIADNTHVLGGEIGCLMQLLKSRYIKKEEIMPGDPQTRTVIRKPSIYASVQSLDKYFKKEVKATRIQEQDAKTILRNVILTALAALDAPASESFEDALSDRRKDAGKLLEIFDQVKLSNLY